MKGPLSPGSQVDRPQAARWHRVKLCEIILRVFSLPILEASPAMAQGLAGRPTTTELWERSTITRRQNVIPPSPIGARNVVRSDTESSQQRTC
jgi:hypothetical protein